MDLYAYITKYRIQIHFIKTQFEKIHYNKYNFYTIFAFEV